MSSCSTWCRNLLVCSLPVLLTVFMPAVCMAQSASIIASFTPEEGRIVDAALMANGHLALLYPDAGRIADYTLDGELHQHIVREAGVERRFKPTACVSGPGDTLLVFDEVSHKVFYIGADGNISRGIDLAYPGDEGGTPLALSRIGDLAYGGGSLIWVMLPERDVFAGFNSNGELESQLDLAIMLPYSQAVYTRGQLLPDGSLFLLDYHQGAVLYRRGATGQFRRLMLGTPEDLTAAPMVQDFAVDQDSNVLLATYDEDAPLLLLCPGRDGYRSHRLDLNMPGEAHRLACRWSEGKFIVWLKDDPVVFILEVR